VLEKSLNFGEVQGGGIGGELELGGGRTGGGGGGGQLRG